MEGKQTYLFTSESVTRGHPDATADAIADAVLDACLEQDPASRVACEVLVTEQTVVLAGEITTRAKVDLERIARQTIKDIGYVRPDDGFSYASVTVYDFVHAQSSDIALGVDRATDVVSFDTGAGDIGIMFGYATSKDMQANLMPFPLNCAHQLTYTMDHVSIPGKRPDGKAQVTVEYDKATGKPLRIHTVVLCVSHAADVDLAEFKRALVKEVIEPVCGMWMDSDTIVTINPTGRFVIHGPAGDTGLTGRKIVVAQYGGACAVGGGAFSGKDATKVDRSGAYIARWIAQNLVRDGVNDEVSVQIAYAIGQAKPVSVRVMLPGKPAEYEMAIEKWVMDNVDVRPASIIKRFGLRKPMFKKYAAYGHMGWLNAPWEGHWEYRVDME